MKKIMSVAVAKIACVMVLTLALSSPGLAIMIDGFFDPSEGYTTQYSVDFDDLDGGVVTGGELWLFEDSTTKDVSIVFILPLDLVDNTYGANAIGWGTEGHDFGELVGSDKLELEFRDGNDVKVLAFSLDYISEIPNGSGNYSSAGGKIGKHGKGELSKILDWGTSLDYNFNTLNHNTYTTDSPDATTPYGDPDLAPGWVYEIIYEIQVDGSLFADNGFGGVNPTLVHASPNKIGKHKMNTVLTLVSAPTDPIPEPATIFLLGSGLVGIFYSRMRGKK